MILVSTVIILATFANYSRGSASGNDSRAADGSSSIRSSTITSGTSFSSRRMRGGVGVAPCMCSSISARCFITILGGGSGRTYALAVRLRLVSGSSSIVSARARAVGTFTPKARITMGFGRSGSSRRFTECRCALLPGRLASCRYMARSLSYGMSASASGTAVSMAGANGLITGCIRCATLFFRNSRLICTSGSCIISDSGRVGTNRARGTRSSYGGGFSSMGMCLGNSTC